jgi:tryptophan halogenase
VPDVLARKTELFAAKAKVLALDEEMFPDSDWVAAWLGQGVEPRAYDALADQPDKAVVRDRLAAMRKAMRAAAEAMPRYEAAR